jgi:hypothetical protein
VWELLGFPRPVWPEMGQQPNCPQNNTILKPTILFFWKFIINWVKFYRTLPYGIYFNQLSKFRPIWSHCPRTERYFLQCGGNRWKMNWPTKLSVPFFASLLQVRLINGLRNANGHYHFTVAMSPSVWLLYWNDLPNCPEGSFLLGCKEFSSLFTMLLLRLILHFYSVQI